MNPDNDYLIKLGLFSYMVTYLEWQVLGDLPKLSGLPAELDLGGLVGKTTGNLGRVLQRSSVLEAVSDIPTRDWLRRAGELLERTAKDRNSVLHARPATVGDKQFLRRWHPNCGEMFIIDDQWLSAAQQRLDNAIRELSQNRVAQV
jgi:hypothetical protein